VSSELETEISKIGRRVFRQVDPGVRAVVAACCVLVLLVAALLPWVESATGWQVVSGSAPAGVTVGLLPTVFAVTAAVFGVLATTGALLTRLWVVAWIAAVGCGFSTVTGVLAIWSQQSSASHQPGPGPGIGLIAAALTMLVLVVQWVRVALTRT